MPLFDSRIDPRSRSLCGQPRSHAAHVAEVRALEQRTRDRSAQSQPLFDKRGQLLPRDRIALLLDPAVPAWNSRRSRASVSTIRTPAKCVPGAGVITGIGMVGGTRCMVVASDSGIEAGSFRAMALEKILRAQHVRWTTSLPFVHLVESAGANLLRYKVEGFVGGGAMFHNLARLSAGTARGDRCARLVDGGWGLHARLVGLRDHGARTGARFWPGRPCSEAATGEIATEENLGGAEMHTAVSGLGEYMANDADGVRLAREVVKRLQWSRHLAGRPRARQRGARPALRFRGSVGHHVPGRPQARGHARSHRAHRR